MLGFDPVSSAPVSALPATGAASPTAALLRRYRYTRQPQGPVTLDKGHPLARGLVLSAFNSARDYCGAPVNYVANTLGVRAGSGFATDANGVTALYNGTSDAANLPLSLTARQATFSFRLNASSYPADGIPMEYSPTWGSNAGFLVDTNSSGSYVFGVSGTGGTGAGYHLVSITAPSLNVYHDISVTVDRNVASTPIQNVYVDGVPVSFANVATTFAASDWLTNTSLYLMARGSSSLWMPGRLSNVNVHNRILSAGEAQALHANPWAILTPPPARVASFGSANPNVTLTGQTATTGQGAFTFPVAGQTATTSQGILTPLITILQVGQTATTKQGFFFEGTQTAVTSQGVLKPAVNITLTGQTATTGQGSFFFAVIGQTATTSQGSLTPLISVSGVSQTATTGQGALTPSDNVTLTGQTATTGQGTIPIIAALTGQTMYTGPGNPTAKAPTSFGIGAGGVSAAGAIGAVTISIASNGVSAAPSINPSVTSATFTHAGGGVIGLNVMLQTGMAYHGKIAWGMEQGQFTSAQSWQAKGTGRIPQDGSLTPLLGYTNVYGSDTLDPGFGGSHLQPYEDNGTYTHTDSLNYFDGYIPQTIGGVWNFDQDGVAHLVYTRSKWDPAHNTGANYLPNYFDSNFSWTTEGQNYPGDELTRPIGIPLYTSVAGPMGVYGINANTALVFYPKQVVVRNNASIPLVGQTLTTGQGNAYGFHGQTVTVKQGSVQVQGVRALVGLTTTTGQGQLYFDGVSNSWVPAFRKHAGTSPTAFTLWSDEYVLGNFTGTAAINAASSRMTVVRSGYGDTIYLVYLSNTDIYTDTPANIGVIVLNARTLQAVSHTLYALPTALTPMAATNLYTTGVGNTGQVPPQRPMAEVAVLSTGTSVTQFLIGKYVVNLSWTAGTATAPTITTKTGPTFTGGMVPGWESLEIRGDQAFHVLYDIVTTGSYGQTHTYRYYYNDATGTGATWTSSGSAFLVQTQLVNPYYAIDLWHSAFGGGEQYPTFLYNNCSTNNLGMFDTAATAAVAWLKFWAGNPPIATVAATGLVGACQVTIGQAAQLVGQTLTSGQGAVGNFPEYLNGQTAAVSQGGFSFAANVTLIGQGLTTSQGTLSLIVSPPSQTATTGQGVLTPTVTGLPVGLSITSSQGLLNPGVTCALVGQGMTSGQGVLVPANAPALTGQTATSGQGILKPGTACTLTGQALITSQGTVIPLVAPNLVGQLATSGLGAFQVFMARALAGQTGITGQGTFTLHADQNLTVTGVQAQGVVGSPIWPAAQPGAYFFNPLLPTPLFAQVPPTLLNAQVLPTPLFAQVPPLAAFCQTPQEQENAQPSTPLVEFLN